MKNRFLFIPITCLTMILLVFVYKSGVAVGFSGINFAGLDSRLVSQRSETVEASNAKHPVMPETFEFGNGNVDINNATIEELETLPKIGEKRAATIVEQRVKMGGFSTLKDLLCTNGIGIEIYKDIEPYIKITRYNESSK